ncbi:ATP-NAD kinase [Haladaptatus pallidirubidus]|uniref:NAD(+)/NADH kinase n=1 Tax=Haladaptatus pallidirubidus TaxID=1008152 RepID=A0AAV3UAR7_9EURY|nr:ATP-NAD kinase [Haladaptatus pallidirubidus]
MRIGVVPSENADSSLVARIETLLAEETSTIDENARAVLDADSAVVVAVGKSAVTDLVRAGVSVPVLPVDAGAGLESVPAGSIEPAVETLLSNNWTTTERPLLSASVDGEHVADALFDATLVTSEPARISEYAVKAGGKPVAQFRADAVVTATPAGSRGYARDAGGPVVQPDSGVVSVVPVAPFAIHVDNWVLRGPVTLSVERDEDAVVLLADDREVCPVEPHEPVELACDDVFLVPAVSSERSFFEP